MGWKKLKDEEPAKWTYVLVGYLDDQANTVWQIARMIPGEGWQFWNKRETKIGAPCKTAGPGCGDTFNYINTREITHWMYVDEIEESDNKMKHKTFRRGDIRRGRRVTVNNNSVGNRFERKLWGIKIVEEYEISPKYALGDATNNKSQE